MERIADDLLGVVAVEHQVGALGLHVGEHVEDQRQTLAAARLGQERLHKRRESGDVRLDVKAAYIGKKIFEVRGLSKRFGDKVILDGFDYRFARYEKMGIVGDKGTGKSTFINSFAGKACAKTGNKPGVTKGKQWIRLSKTLELLDTPGILWPKFEDQQVGLNLALIGSMNDEILNIEEMAVSLIQYLKDVYPLLLTKRYDLSDEAEESCKNEQDAYEVLAQIARNRKCVLKGDEPDIRKAAALLLDDFRSGRIGRITLESPTEQA